jgi:hypothetical protein
MKAEVTPERFALSLLWVSEEQCKLALESRLHLPGQG